MKPKKYAYIFLNSIFHTNYHYHVFFKGQAPFKSSFGINFPLRAHQATARKYVYNYNGDIDINNEQRIIKKTFAQECKHNQHLSCKRITNKCNTEAPPAQAARYLFDGAQSAAKYALLALITPCCYYLTKLQ